MGYQYDDHNKRLDSFLNLLKNLLPLWIVIPVAVGVRKAVAPELPRTTPEIALWLVVPPIRPTQGAWRKEIACLKGCFRLAARSLPYMKLASDGPKGQRRQPRRGTRNPEVSFKASGASSLGKRRLALARIYNFMSSSQGTSQLIPSPDADLPERLAHQPR